MEMGRAVAYIFEDKQWVSKLIPLLIIGVLSLFPVLGLFAVAVGLGYVVQLARNVRDGLPRPLPGWKDWQDKMNSGAQVLLAMLIYHLPVLLMSICSYTLIAGVGGGFLGTGVSVIFFCCTAPLLFVYTVLAWAMLAVGMGEFIETGDTGRMFRFVHLWDVVRANNNAVFQWLLYTILATIVMGIIGVIPCIGWIAVLLFAYPVQGHLLGQFIHRLSVRKKSKAKNSK